jgi:hypothetical protein
VVGLGRVSQVAAARQYGRDLCAQA